MFLRIRGVCHVHIRCMGIRQESNIRSQVDIPKSVGGISCADNGCELVDDDSNIFLSIQI